MAIDWSAARKKAEELDKDLERYAHKPSNTGREEASGTGQSIQVKTRTNKSAPPAALPESKGKGILLPKTGVDLRLPGQRAEAEEKLDAVKQEQRILAARENVARRSGGFTLEDAKTYEAEKGPLRQRAQGLQTDIDRIDYIREYERIRRGDNFGGQFLASYDMGRMGQDEANAWSEYLANPTESNRAYAEAVSATRGHYAQRNAAALDEDAALPIISQSFAGYLPQLIDENIAGAKGAALGAGTGTVLPGIGTAVGAKVGYTAGRAAYGYQTMQGMAFKALLDAGVDEETARAAANDEALIGSLMEGGDAAIDMLTLGLGKGLKALLKKPVQEAAGSAGRKIASALGKYGINIASEGAQEWVQEGISLANQNRSGTGTLNLVGETAGQIGRALSGQDPDALSQMNAAGIEGMKIAALMSGAAAGRNAVVNSIQNGRPRSQARQQNNAATMMLPTSEQSPDGRIYLPGSPAYQRSAVDNPSGAVYDGGTQNIRTGGVNDGGRETAAPELQGVYAADVRGGDQRTYTGGEGASSQTDGGKSQETSEWAKGHLIETPTPAARRVLSSAKQYAPDVFVVDDATIKSKNPSAWALTSGGKIYISDAVPENLADVIGYHESVHALKQRGSQQYNSFMNQIGERLNYGEDADQVLGIILQSRLKGKSILDLTMDELDTAYDELNAVIWGYHKADPENARAQFSGAFQDYDAYIQELDTIMEGARQPVENQTGVGPAQAHGPESSVGAARKGFDPWSEFQGTKSEFFPEGANAARPVDVPTTDPQGRRIRKTASTAMGAKAIPDEVVGDIQNMVLRGELSYDRVSDKSSINRAIRTIKEKEFWGALEEFRNSVSKGVVSKDIATLGQQLLINAANAGDGKATAELLSLYAQMETTAGQAVQAASILRKLAPSDQLYAAKRVVSELEKTIQKNYKDLEITIDPSLIEEFNQQTDQAGRDAVLDKIYQNVADQVPAKWKDKWNAWRYMAMLFNPRTHIRNIVGNVGFQPLRWTKDRVAATIEAGVSKVSGGRLGRTKSFAANPALYKAAWADWSNVRDVLSGNKYDDIRTEINSRRRIFRTAPLEAGRKINSWALEAEDAIFKRITYADALAGYLQSNGVTAEQMRNNTVDTQLLSRARDYAGREALKATYQDRNKVSDKVVQIARALGPAGEAVLPFKRTPANILVRGMEYSPAGLAKTLTYDLIQVKRGKLTGAEAIDHIASGLTGSGLMALGAYLFAQGIVTSGGGDDEGQDTLNDLTGVQNYALNLPGGGNVTLDWLAPEALPFFMGVELMDSAGQGGSTAESISTALKSISDPMLELSMLQSLNDVIDSVSFSENKLGALVSSALVSYFTQPIPTFGGQIERSAEDVRMTTYTDKNLRLPTDLQYAIGRASARIPGWDYQQMPYIDAWGREDSSGPLWLRMANNFLNPAYTSNKQVTPVDEEIQRIYDQTGDASVVPQRPERYITVDGERIDLSKEKYEQYATKRGQMQFEMLGNIIDNPTYRSMSDTDKAFVIDSVYEYADKTTKSEISSYRLDGWVKTAAQSDLSPEDYILFRAATVDIEGDKDENGKTIPGSKKKKVLNVIDQMNVSDEVKDKYYYAAGYDEDTISDAPWHGWGWW